jgi:hypothetical protein
MFETFNWSLLESKSFKEDAVREELIAPMLNRLGYSASGKHRIYRSVPLTHPFVKLGSKRHRIKLIPDYTLEAANQKRWILEAKPPFESTYGENAQQAYSYAIHPEVRARYFAVCNGKQFTAYDIFSLEPILDFKLSAIKSHWMELMGLLGPNALQIEQRSTISKVTAVARQITAIIDGLGKLQFPISVESVRDAVSISQATERGRYVIKLIAKDVRTQHILGMTLRYKGRAEIIYSAQLNQCYKRFSVCNELCSIVFPSNQTFRLDDVSRPMEALGALAPSLSADAETDILTLRFFAMIEILIPWRLRSEIEEWQQKRMSHFEIASRLRVPMQVLEVFLNGYWQQSNAIHKKLDAEYKRVD